MMITDDTLILYYYDEELTAVERERIARELELDAELSQKYALLCEDMGRLREDMDPERAVVDHSRWSRVLREAAVESPRQRKSAALSNGRRLSAVAATLLVFVAGLVIGGRMKDESNVVAVQPAVAIDALPSEPLAPRESHGSFERGIATHFADTRIQLASLDMGNAQERDALIYQLVSQNRFYVKAARQNGAEDVARLLRAFEPLLLSLSSGSEKETRRSDEQIREQLEFELNISLTKIGAQSSNRSNEFL